MSSLYELRQLQFLQGCGFHLWLRAPVGQAFPAWARGVWGHQGSRGEWVPFDVRASGTQWTGPPRRRSARKIFYRTKQPISPRSSKYLALYPTLDPSIHARRWTGAQKLEREVSAASLLSMELHPKQLMVDWRCLGSSRAERWNGRLAMIGFLSMLLTESFIHTPLFTNFF
ncbi:hypothetical protein R1flu_024840 [Riccia fluitans]|uniref:High light inducible protein n=1 Tax=Riccia fluitans TaxID=41844 RepID=A0ABD1XW21_9MARC